MINAYSELYLNDAKENLAVCFDYALRQCRIDIEFFTSLFLFSGYDEQFERGNPAFISGMSGIELARKIISYGIPDYEFPEPDYCLHRSAYFWAGWALAQYQWQTCRRFRNLFEKISLREIIEMYPLYHEMDIERFVEALNETYHSVKQETHLKSIRQHSGLSQQELSQLSGVKLRSIQMYEQRVNDIDKAQAQTLYKLSRVLGCDIEDLLETPEQ